MSGAEHRPRIVFEVGQLQIGNGARHAQGAMYGARRESQPLACLCQQAATIAIKAAMFLDLVAGEFRVELARA